MAFAEHANIAVTATIPMSALKGDNVVTATEGWCGYTGPVAAGAAGATACHRRRDRCPLAFPVQWVEKFSFRDTSQGRRVFWGRVATGPGACGRRRHCAAQRPECPRSPRCWTTHATRRSARAGPRRRHRAGPRGGRVARRLAAGPSTRSTPLTNLPTRPSPRPSCSREIKATVAWMDDEPLIAGRVYWALHGPPLDQGQGQAHRAPPGRQHLEEHDAGPAEPNAIGHIELALQEPIAALPYARRAAGSLILVDTASHKTSGPCWFDLKSLRETPLLKLAIFNPAPTS